MHWGKVRAGLSGFLVIAFGSGCMRFHSDVYYEHRTQIEIVEDGSNGSKLITNAAYREWGLGPGEDGIYGTGDDDLAGGYTRIIRDKADRLESVSYSESPGPDGLWFTGDDKLISLASFITDGNMEVWTMRTSQLASLSTVLDDIFYPPSLRGISEGSVGGSAFSGRPRDSNFSSVYSFQPHFLANLASIGRGGGQDIDGRSSYQFIRVTTAAGLEVRQVLSSGVDSRWGTSDDLVERIWRLTKKGAVYSILEYSEPGPDRLWGTQDDIFASGAYLELNVAGEIVVERYVTDLGVDKLPFTVDDNYVAAIDRRSWSAGARSFVSVSSALQAGPSDVGPVDNLTYKFTDLFVFDSTSLPNYWTGAAEHFFVNQHGDPSKMAYQLAQRKSLDETGGVPEVEFYTSSSLCLPSDFITLEPCVARIRQEKLPDSTVSQRLQRLSDTTIKIEYLYADPMNYGYNSKFIKVDRTPT